MNRMVLCCAILILAGIGSANEALENNQISKGYSIKKTKPEKTAPCSTQGNPVEGQSAIGYNAPAAVDVASNRLVSWFADASFLYWYGGEEGLSLASDGVLSSGTAYFPTRLKSHYQTFHYKPGFKLGLGLIAKSDWVVRGEYTWLRGTNSSSISPSSNSAAAGTILATTGTPVLVVNDWFLLGTQGGQALSASSVSASWHYALDLADLMTSRPFYQGSCLTVTPSAGLRAAWIRQKMDVSLTEASGLFGTTLPSNSRPDQPIKSHNYSNSWGLGPRFGLETDMLLPMGFRFEGNLAASLLYTNYTRVSHAESPASISFNQSSYKSSLHNYGCLRTMAEMGLGFGWSRYLFCNKYHLDFSASYDFTYMWNQNMMRKLLDDVLTGTGSSSSDLYFHGLTLTGQFNF